MEINKLDEAELVSIKPEVYQNLVERSEQLDIVTREINKGNRLYVPMSIPDFMLDEKGEEMNVELSTQSKAYRYELHRTMFHAFDNYFPKIDHKRLEFARSKFKVVSYHPEQYKEAADKYLIAAAEDAEKRLKDKHEEFEEKLKQAYDARKRAEDKIEQVKLESEAEVSGIKEKAAYYPWFIFSSILAAISIAGHIW